MVKEWCNSGSTWDYILRAEAGKKSRSAEENKKLIALMCGIGINAANKPEPKKLQLSKEAAEECVNAVNGATMIPHPTVDDQRKCIFCRTAVALHMAMLNNLDKEKGMNSTIATHACLLWKKRCDFYRQSSKLRMSGCTIPKCAS